MTLEEFNQLLDLQGSDMTDWPARQRAAARPLLASDPQAAELLAQYRQLDAALDAMPTPALEGLEARVLNQALPPRPQSLLDRLIDWLIPGEGFGPRLWRPAVAACLPLLCGILLGNFYHFGVVGTELDEVQYWEDELALLSLSDYSENGF